VAGEGESGQVPNLIKEVASDLQRPKPINVHFGFAPAENRGSFWIWEHEDEGNSAGCGIAQDDSPEARVDWRTASGAVLCQTRVARREARPECPAHSHPAVSKELDGEAWWVCPVDHHRVGQIGGLGQ
jgi:hypothetical protein